MNRFFFSFLFLSVFVHVSSFAQKACYELTYDLIADNREYSGEYAIPQTILASRLDVQGGFEVDSNHSVFVGLNHLQEHGHPIDGYKPVMDLYYHYQDTVYNLYLGSFPRRGLLNYPLIMLSDSLGFYRPNLQGGFAQVKGKWWKQAVWCDWTSRQTDSVRETFLVGITGRFDFGVLFLEDQMHYWHRAGNATTLKDVRDNMALAGFIGIDLKRFIKVDSLTLSTGVVNTMDRNRTDDIIHPSTGSLSRLAFRYNKKFGLDLAYYNGGAPSLEFGDKIYSAKNYLRADFIWTPITTKYVRSAVKACMHYVNGEWDHSYQIFLTAQINNKRR